MAGNPVRYGIVAPMLAGKSTPTQPRRWLDIDDARVDELEPFMKELRTRRDWSAHDALWWPQVQTWLASQPPRLPLAAHDSGILIALGITPLVAVLPAEPEWTRRAAARQLTRSERKLARLNRTHVLDWTLRHQSVIVASDMLSATRLINIITSTH